MTNTLFVNDGGTGGIPVVFLHSLAGSSAHWASQLEMVRQTRRAIAVDLRGHGSSFSAESFTLEEMADDVVRTLDVLGIDQFVLIGHSMGSAVAIKLAGSYPERLAGLLLADAAGDSTQIPQEQLAGMLGALNSPAYDSVINGYWLELLDHAPESNRKRLMGELAAMPAATIVAIFNELVRYNPLSDFDNFSGPKQLISTAHADAPFALHVLRPAVAHVRMEGVSHWLQLDNSAEFNSHLSDFLARIG